MKTILRAIILTLSFVLVFAGLSRPTVLAATPPQSGIDFAALDTVISAQMAKHGLPGVALAVIENGEVVYLKGYGSAGMNRAMTPQTPMFIGSQSKSFTALAIAQLADQGKLDLNAPLQTYIPWFRVADEAAARQITINHLLHHTSGLSDAGYGVLLPLDASLEQTVRSLAQAQITAPVGTKHQYFNTGYSVLAYLIELTSGESYASYIRNHILTPLGMRSTSAAPTTASGVAQGYSRLFGFPLAMQQDIPAYAVGAGYIISTAEDLARYALAVQNGGARLVSPERMREILTPGVGAYGMGWYIVDDSTKIFHGGANETFRTEVNLYPTRQRAFVLLTNQGYQVDHFISAGQLTASVEALVLGNPPPSVAQGWSVQWIGWGLGLLVLGLLGLHTRNFLALRGWSKRIRTLSPARQVLDVSISFLIPTVILLVIYSQVKAFYGDRFNLLTNLIYLRQGLPDVFILMLVGTLPDYLQGILKIILRFRKSER